MRGFQFTDLVSVLLLEDYGPIVKSGIMSCLCTLRREIQDPSRSIRVQCPIDFVPQTGG